MKRKQYAALPYRIEKTGMKILLITTRKKGKWSIPKGWPIKGRMPHVAARIEAFEEAGILGAIGREKVGRFTHRKIKGARTVTCAVDVFPLAVRDKLDRWPEQHERKRRWFSGKAAANVVGPKGLRRAISDIIQDA